MRSIKQWGLWGILTPLLSLIIWVFSERTLVHLINILFILSIVIFIIFFLILIVQEGVFDTTSYGFRRLKYQLQGKTRKEMYKHDEFFNPKQVKKDTYIISNWIFPALICNLIYFILCIIISIAI